MLTLRTIHRTRPFVHAALALVAISLLPAFTSLSFGQPPPLNRSWTLYSPEPGFGTSLAIASTTSPPFDLLAVGSPGSATSPGVVYVYRRHRPSAIWELNTVLRAPHSRPGDRFGAAVAFNHWMLLVGAPGDNLDTDELGHVTRDVEDRGACHLFVYTWQLIVVPRPRMLELVERWDHVARIEPALTAGDSGAGARFGSGVAFFNEQVVVGAPFHDAGGKADTGGVWMGTVGTTPPARTWKLPNVAFPDALLVEGQRLGASVAALSPSRLIIGGPGQEGSTETHGAAVTWSTGSGAFNRIEPLVPAAGFGASVAALRPAVPDGAAVSAVIGAPGSTSVVLEPDGTLSPLPIVATTNTEARYGAAVASLSDGTVFLGPANGTASLDAGSVVAFRRRSDGSWARAFTLPVEGATGKGGHGFGSAIVASGDYVAVAAPTRSPSPFVTIFDLSTLDGDLDGLPDNWESTTGLDPSSAAGDDGASGDPDGDGITNAEEYAGDTHPRGVFRLHFAEGTSRWLYLGGFGTSVAVANPGVSAAHVQLRQLGPLGGVRTAYRVVAPNRSVVQSTETQPSSGYEFSTVIESDVPVIADREMAWSGPWQGSHAAVLIGTHAERAVPVPSSTWHFAEGATHSGFDTFYLLANTSDAPMTVHATFLLANAGPLDKDYTLPPHSRTTVWANQEDFPAGSGQRLLTSADFGASFTSPDHVGFIAERAMYTTWPGLPFLAGHASAGATVPATRWMFAEGATGYFDEFLLLANPDVVPVDVRVTFLLPDGRAFTRDVPVGAQARVNVWVNLESFDGGVTFPLAQVSHSTVVETLSGTGIVAERSMWWRSADAPETLWSEGHNAFGATDLGTAWMSAMTRSGEPASRCCEYLLVANPNAAPVSVRLTMAVGLDSGVIVDRSWDYSLVPESRLTIPLHDLDVTMATPASPVRLEVLGDEAPGIFVEQASYDARFQAGSCRLLTRLR